MRYFKGYRKSEYRDRKVPIVMGFRMLMGSDTRLMGFCYGCYLGVAAQEIPLGWAHGYTGRLCVIFIGFLIGMFYYVIRECQYSMPPTLVLCSAKLPCFPASTRVLIYLGVFRWAETWMVETACPPAK